MNIVHHQLGIFLGAGASWDAGLPLGDSAARHLIQSIFKSLSMETKHKDLSEFEKLKKINLWPRFEVVIKTFEEYIPYSSKNIVHTFLNCGISSTCQTLVKTECRRIWFTTNFDNQIELALENAGIEYKLFANREELQNLSFNEHKCDLVIKLHGDSSVLNINNSLGASIDQILKKLPEKIATNILDQLNVDDFLFIGYAARDPDLHSFISKLIKQCNNLSWIDLGPCGEKISKLVNKKFDYYSEGSPRALEKIYGIKPLKAKILQESWYEKVDELIASFPKEALAHIAADLCFLSNNNITFSTIRLIHDKLDKEIPENLFNINRRQIQMLFHSPTNGTNESINKHLKELQKLSSSSQDPLLSSKIDLFVSNVIWRVNSPQDSIKRLQSIANNFRKDSEAYVELLILMGIAKIYSGASLYKAGIDQLENAKELAIYLNFPIQEAEANLRLAIAHMRGSNPEKSEHILRKTKSIFYELGNQRRIFIWHLNLAESIRIQRKLEEALVLLEDLIDDASIAEDMEVLLNAIGNKGLILTSIGRLAEGDLEFLNVIRLANKVESNKESMANALYNQGWLRIICCSWGKAISYLTSAAESFEKDYFSPERRGGALSLIGVSEYFLGYKDKSKATLEYIESKGIVPSGNMRSDFKLLKFLNSHPLNKTILGDARLEFYEDPEQLFYINYMLLQEKPLDNQLVENCIECAKEAKLVPYWHIIHGHILKWNLDLKAKDIKLVEKSLLDNFEFTQD